MKLKEILEEVHYIDNKHNKVDVFEKLRKEWKEKDVDISIYSRSSNRYVSLSKIEVDKKLRKQGLATKAMKDLIKVADENNLIITLSPTSEFGSSKSRLIEFYKRFGFVQNIGRNKDFHFAATMYRNPN